MNRVDQLTRLISLDNAKFSLLGRRGGSGHGLILCDAKSILQEVVVMVYHSQGLLLGKLRDAWLGLLWFGFLVRALVRVSFVEQDVLKSVELEQLGREFFCHSFRRVLPCQ